MKRHTTRTVLIAFTGAFLWAVLAFPQESPFLVESPDVPEGSYGPGMSEDVVVQYDEETGSLIVVTDEETNAHIKTVVEALDRPVPQVLINVLFLEVTHSEGLDLGTEFFAQDIDTRTTYTVFQEDDGTYVLERGAEVNRQDIAETVFGLAEEASGAFYRLLKDDLEVTVRALAEAAKLEVLSRPSILTRNNQEATITVGQEVPFIRNTRILQDGQQLNTVEYEDIGIILEVTPHIRPDGLVEMQVIPEITTLTGETVPIAAGVEAPVFAKRSAETGIVVPDGQTVVIGGLMEDQKTESTRKIPLLGDIPILGHAFRRKIDSKAKTELLIFLTPYIVPEPGNLIHVTASERERAQLSTKTFSQEEFDRYTAPLVPSAEAQSEAGDSEPPVVAPPQDKPQRRSNRGVFSRGRLK
jgi:general secretion pathway protein D